jgi:hypothetical protein
MNNEGSGNFRAEESSSHESGRRPLTFVNRRKDILPGFRSSIVAAVFVAVAAPPAVASPFMIRLGYSTCTACHVSPQGGGLLTPYGQGVDVAQSLRSRELEPSNSELRRFLYDVRFVAVGLHTDDLSGQTQPVSAATYELMFRSSALISEHNRLSYTFELTGSPVLGNPTTTGASIVFPKVLWEYRPKEGLDFAVGRDELPSGLGLPDTESFIRQATDPGATAYPTQAKLFWWNRRFQLTPYAFAPGGEVDSRNRQWGAGMLGGIDVWHERAILGLSVMDSRAIAFEHRSTGAYARLGFGRWGILAEHELTGRTTTDSPATTSYIAGDTQLFVAPYEWLVASLALDELVSQASPDGSSHVYRIAPGAQVRVSENLTVVFTTRDVVSDASLRRSRTYSLQVAVKTVR